MDDHPTRTVTDAEFRKLIEHSDNIFRDVLTALKWTGCRPVEIRSLIWEWVDLEQGLWILPDHKTITRQRDPLPRVIPLSPQVLEICQRLALSKHKKSDHVFLNGRGAPYTKDALCRKMSKLRKRAGIELKAGQELVLYHRSDHLARLAQYQTAACNAPRANIPQKPYSNIGGNVFAVFRPLFEVFS